MSYVIDLNLDAGESLESLNDGTEAALYQCVTSVNIACGGHTGNQETMLKAVRLAKTFGCSVGAHPSYPDREGFGRRIIEISPAALLNSISEQVKSLELICQSEGVELKHLKAHGALYNEAARDSELARILITTVKSYREPLILVGLAHSQLLDLAKAEGVRVAAEGFVDRRYEADLSLRSRKFADAMLESPEQAAHQAVQLALGEPIVSASGEKVSVFAQTLCIHGDAPGGLATAQAVRRALETRQIQISALA